MSRSPRVSSDGDAAERRPGGAGADAQDELSRLLAVLSAPAHPDELAGEEAVMSAFLSHHASQVRQGAGRRSVPATVAKFVTVKVALATALAVAATGGVAFAATSGALPDALGGDRWTPSSRQHSTPKPSVPAGTAPIGSSPKSPHDLCRSYRVRTSEGAAGTLDDPQFRTLIEAAGGRNEVPRYCDGLLGPADDSQQSKPSADPPGSSNGKPGHPTGKPTSVPGEPAEPPGLSGKPDRPGAGPPSASPTRQSGRPTAQPAQFAITMEIYTVVSSAATRDALKRLDSALDR
ncbi:hypothetical protein ACLQ28_06045 [Micromonospora sp. DT201]|uniref:hypothetical protein n=1 Tax=Micromonospora sp. DT201 TaxID=3393442 RepID=UPI003CF35225